MAYHNQIQILRDEVEWENSMRFFSSIFFTQPTIASWGSLKQKKEEKREKEQNNCQMEIVLIMEKMPLDQTRITLCWFYPNSLRMFKSSNEFLIIVDYDTCFFVYMNRGEKNNNNIIHPFRKLMDLTLIRLQNLRQKCAQKIS